MTRDEAGRRDSAAPRVIADTEARQLAAPWSFASVLRPLQPAEFLAEHWGERPLHVARSCPDFYSGLMSLGDLERYLSLADFFALHEVDTPSAGVGLPQPPPATLGELSDRILDRGMLRLRRMERFLDPGGPVMSLVRDMQMVLQHPLGSLSCYVAPPDAVGLGPHHDETEIFTLQLSGVKRWRVYHRVESDKPGIHPRESLGAPVLDLRLRPGDLLYMPRGWVHDVIAETPAFSLTIVFDPIRWGVLLATLASDLVPAAPFAAPLPAGALLGGRDGREALRRQLADRVRLLQDAIAELDADRLADAVAPRLLARMTMPPVARFEQLFRLNRLTSETCVERPPEVAWHLALRGDRAVLTLAGGFTLEMIARVEPALRAALAREGAFRIGDMPDGLAASAKLSLARRLIACGLLRVVTTGTSEAAAPAEPAAG